MQLPCPTPRRLRLSRLILGLRLLLVVGRYDRRVPLIISILPVRAFIIVLLAKPLHLVLVIRYIWTTVVLFVKHIHFSKYGIHPIQVVYVVST